MQPRRRRQTHSLWTTRQALLRWDRFGELNLVTGEIGGAMERAADPPM
jgi:hypothetical protein